MTRYVVRYAEENYGIITFDANSKEEAETLVAQAEQGEIEIEDLPNYSSTVKSSNYSLTALEEVQPFLPPIPIMGIIV
jgi:hypothetical protein